MTMDEMTELLLLADDAISSFMAYWRNDDLTGKNADSVANIVQVYDEKKERIRLFGE